MTERKVSNVKNSVKLFLLGLFVSLALFFIGFLVWNYIAFPMSRQNVDGKLENHSILAFQEEAGILVFITETNHSYVIHIFVPSIIFNRYRLHTQHEYSNTFITAVPGRVRYFVLEADRALIEFIRTEVRIVQSHHILNFLTITIITMSTIYRIYQFYLKKKLRESHPHSDF
jgi:hypothetical protein